MVRMWLQETDLVVPAVCVLVAYNVGLRMLGVTSIVLTGKEGVSCSQMIYFSEGIDNCYLSKSVCRDLAIILEEFPAVGQFTLGLVAVVHQQSDSRPTLETPVSPASNPSGNAGAGVGVKLIDSDDDVFQ